MFLLWATNMGKCGHFVVINSGSQIFSVFSHVCWCVLCLHVSILHSSWCVHCLHDMMLPSYTVPGVSTGDMIHWPIFHSSFCVNFPHVEMFHLSPSTVLGVSTIHMIHCPILHIFWCVHWPLYTLSHLPQFPVVSTVSITWCSHPPQFLVCLLFAWYDVPSSTFFGCPLTK